MADGSKIEWTDATWNPITGCSVVSPGCTNCYAMKLAGTRLAHLESRAGLTRDSKAGPVWTGEVRLNEEWLVQPLRWRKPRMIFVCAHGDLFHESIPDEWIDRVFAVMALAPQHTFQVLTKRSARMREYMERSIRRSDALTCARRIANGEKIACSHLFDDPPHRVAPWPPQNIWLGVSVEDQTRANERIPELLATPAAVRWISAEPLLGPVNLSLIQRSDGAVIDSVRGEIWYPGVGSINSQTFRGPIRLNWVIAGGESGPGARPMHPDWARSLRDQCADAGVPFLFKQWGEHLPDDQSSTDCQFGSQLGHDTTGKFSDNLAYWRVGKTRAGRLLDGVRHDAFPETRG